MSKWNSDLESVVCLEKQDYSWDTFQVWWCTTDGLYYWLRDSGCSCNYFAEDVTSKSGLTRGSQFEALNATSAVGLDMVSRGNISEQDAKRAIELLMNHQGEINTQEHGFKFSLLTSIAEAHGCDDVDDCGVASNLDDFDIDWQSVRDDMVDYFRNEED